MSLPTSFLCPLFFFPRYPSVFPPPCQTFLVLSIRAVPFLPPVNTNYQPKMGSNWYSIHALQWQDGPCSNMHVSVISADLCDPFTTLNWCRGEESFTPLLASIFPSPSLFHIPSVCLKNSERPTQVMEKWCAVFEMELDWNWTLVTQPMFKRFFFHFSPFLWHHCNNSPLAGTLRCPCVLWVMWCNPKWSSLTTEKKKKKDMNMNIKRWSRRASAKKKKEKKNVLIFLEKKSRWTEKNE